MRVSGSLRLAQVGSATGRTNGPVAAIRAYRRHASWVHRGNVRPMYTGTTVPVRAVPPRPYNHIPESTCDRRDAPSPTTARRTATTRILPRRSSTGRPTCGSCGSGCSWRSSRCSRSRSPSRPRSSTPSPRDDGGSILVPTVGIVVLAVVLGGLTVWLARRVLEPAERLDRARVVLEDAYTRARAESLRDSLTGLGNHRAFQEELERHVGRRDPLPAAASPWPSSTSTTSGGSTTSKGHVGRRPRPRRRGRRR